MTASKMNLQLSVGVSLLIMALTLSGAEAGLQHRLDEWAGEKPGVIVALTVDETGVHFYAAGRWSDAEPDRSIDRSTAFEIGSISKVLTALLAAEALADRALSWQDAVPAVADEKVLTFHQLATHTSGLPRLPRDFPDRGLSNPYRDISRDELKASLTLEMSHRPDESVGQWAYSNFGFAVLGQAAAMLLELDYERAVQTRVLPPLGMTETRMHGGTRPAWAEGLAPGHNSAGVALPWEFAAYAPAGAWVSSAADMGRWLQAVLGADADNALPASWESGWREQADAAGPDRMGYGWMIRDVGGADVHWHGGGTGGYRSFIGVQRTTGRGIVILGARDEDVAGIGLGWFQGLFAEPSQGSIDWAASDYVGDYPLAPEFVLAVFAEGQGLMIQATGQPRFPLRAVGPDRFELVGVVATVSFERDQAGEVVGLILHQAGQDMPADRHAVGSKQKVRSGVELPAEQLETLVGRYQLAPQFILTISRSGDQLFAQATGQGNFPIHAEGPDAFYYDVVEARITFQRDDAGEVNGLTLHQGGRDMPAPRLED